MLKKLVIISLCIMTACQASAQGFNVKQVVESVKDKALQVKPILGKKWVKRAGFASALVALVVLVHRYGRHNHFFEYDKFDYNSSDRRTERMISGTLKLPFGYHYSWTHSLIKPKPKKPPLGSVTVPILNVVGNASEQSVFEEQPYA